MSDIAATIDHPYHNWDGEEHFDEELALAALLRDGVLFSNSRPYAEAKEKPAEGDTVVLFVNCNDLFMWGCADAEDIPYSEIEHLYRLHKQTPQHYGALKWCCLRRKMRPQPPLQAIMKGAGAWDDQLAALPANPFEEPTT